MLETLGQDYVRTARAKGLAERRIVRHHAFPNALLPILTLAGLAYAELLAGTVLTETIFSWPGLGRYTYQSALAIDFPASWASPSWWRSCISRSTCSWTSRTCSSIPGSPGDDGASDRDGGAGSCGRRWGGPWTLGVMGALIILLWCIVAVLAPRIAPHLPHVEVLARLKPPSAEHRSGRIPSAATCSRVSSSGRACACRPG